MQRLIFYFLKKNLVHLLNRMTIKETIETNRPTLSKNSVRVYCSLISSLAKSLNVTLDSAEHIKEHIKSILDHLKDMDKRKRKTILASLIVVLGDKDKKVVETLRGHMMKDIRATEEEDKNQEMTHKEKENWISWNEVEKVYDNLKKEVTPLLRMDKLTKRQFTRLQDFVLLSMLTMIPPRRSLDMCELKIRNGDKDNNYVDFKKSKIHWNVYKTAKKYNEQVSDIPKDLMTILKNWLKKNPNDYMFVANDLKTKLSPPQITNRLNSIFGKHISVNMLRKIFITDNVLQNVPALKKLEETAAQMGHTLETAMQKYKKVDAPEVEKEEEVLEKKPKTRKSKN